MGTNFFEIADVVRRGRPGKWGLDYYSPWEFKPNGEKRRKKEFFRTKEKRAERRQELEDRFARLGASASKVPTVDEIEDYRAARAILPAGVPMLRAAQLFVSQRAATRLDLSAFFKAYIESLRVRKLSGAWLKAVESTTGWFAAFMPKETLVGMVTKEDGRRWMKSLEKEGYGDESRNNYRRRLYGAFQWAVKEEIIASNPWDRVEVPEIRRGAPAYYSLAEVRALLATTVLHFPDFVQFAALRFFVGMRRSQILRLVPGDINPERRKIDAPGWREVEIKKGQKEKTRVTKSGDRHLIQKAPEVLWDWISRFPTLHTSGHQEKFRAIHKLAGVKVKKNGYRHSFATYHVEFHGNANLTMQILGQEEDSKAFFDHYRGHADIADAEAFLTMTYTAVVPTLAVVIGFHPPASPKPPEVAVA